jgi:hypothetical protein
MKDVYCCWVGFVAMFSCGVAKKNKEKKTHMSYGLVMNSCKSSLLQIAFHLVMFTTYKSNIEILCS